MGFLKVIVYIICIFTPPFGWVILYCMMRDNRDKKEAIELLDKLENTTKIKAKKEKKYVIPKKEKEKFDKMRKDLGI